MMYPTPALPDVARSFCLKSDAELASERNRLDRALAKIHPFDGTWSRLGYLGAMVFSNLNVLLPGTLPVLPATFGGAVSNALFNCVAMCVLLTLLSSALRRERFHLEPLPASVRLRDMARGNGGANHFLDRLGQLRREHVTADLRALQTLLSQS